MKKTICLLLALCLLAAALAGCGDEPQAGPLYAERGRVSREPLGALAPAADSAAILENLSQAAGDRGGAYEEADPQAEDGAGAALARSLETDAAGSLAQSDGSFLYLLDSYGLIVLSAAGADSELLSYTRIRREGESWDERLFLGPDRVAVLYSSAGAEPEEEALRQDASAVRVTVLDTSDKRAPRELSSLSLEGSLVEACLLDGTLCLVTRRSFWELPPAEQAESLLPRLTENGETLTLAPGDVYLSQAPARTALTTVTALRLSDGRVADALAFTDGVESVRQAGNTLLLSRTFWAETRSEPYEEAPYTVVERSFSARTELRRLRLDGTLRPEGGCVLEGALPDADSLELLERGLRVLTLTDSRSDAAYTDAAHGWTNYEQRGRSRGAQLALLDADLELSGALTHLGGEEPVRAARFAGSTALLLTGREEAPVYAAGLSDPAAPVLGGSLPAGERPAWLLPWEGELVLSIGDPAAEDGWRLAMLDLSDPAAPRVIDSLRLRGAAPASELTDRGILMCDPAAGLIGLPVRTDGKTEYLLVRWTGQELNRKGAIAEEGLPGDARGLLVNGLLYLCSPGAVLVADPGSLELLTTVSNAVG